MITKTIIQLQLIQFILMVTDVFVFVLFIWRKLEYLEETMAICPTW